MTSRYRYNADKGEEVPIESDEERAEREQREELERRELEWKATEAERSKRVTGPYL